MEINPSMGTLNAIKGQSKTPHTSNEGEINFCMIVKLFYKSFSTLQYGKDEILFVNVACR